MSTTRYRIANFGIEVTLPDGCDATTWLPNAEPFRVAAMAEQPILHFSVSGLSADQAARFGKAELLTEDRNDMGIVRLMRSGEELLIEQRFRSTEAMNRMALNKVRNEAKVALHWEAPNSQEALSSLLRAAYAIAVIGHRAVSIHASAISYCDEAILFLGKSGTGKSTHADLWIRHSEGATLLNDDNPTLRLEGDRVMAYGTPWSGKRACYRAIGLPVRGVVRLSQGAINSYRKLEEAEAFMALLPSCSALLNDEKTEDRLCDLLGEVSQRARIGHLSCRPDEEAYLCCREGLGYGA